MCGVTGFVSSNKKSNTLLNMSKKLLHRGPDDFGYWINSDNNVFLAHQRLSIIELSKLGKQPMISPSKNFIISFNGEIYNHLVLRKELENNYEIIWKSNSDTETLLTLIDFYGIEKTLKKLIGMYAFALYDKKNNSVILARDRMGEKPLYYGFQNNNFIFGSELSSLKEFDSFEFRIDKSSLSYFLNYSCIPDNQSIYKDVFQLPPSSYLVFSITQSTFRIFNYWNLQKEIKQNKNISKNISYYTKNIHNHLINSVKLQTISDVPIGCFLSSGIDSSLVASILQSINTSPIKTFSIGFKDKNYNEAIHAKEIANHLNTDHNELYFDNKQILEVVYNLKNIYSEPFADSSQIPTFLLSKMTSDHVKVALSGDGADEIFGGYNRHKVAKNLNILLKIPYPLRKIISTSVKLISSNQYEKFFKLLNFITNKKIINQNIGDKIYKFAKILPSNSSQEIYNLLTTAFAKNNILNKEKNLQIKKNNYFDKSFDHLTNFMLEDTCGYLNEDIITKVDRASMNNSLETRMPYLNHLLIEDAFKIPSNFKFYKKKSKYILKKILENYLPNNLITKKKSGFAVPLKQMLSKDLRDWRLNLIEAIENGNNDFFNINTIKNMNTEFESGKSNSEYLIYNVLIFQDWIMENS